MAVNCIGCGNQLEDDARFCERCGRSQVPLSGSPSAKSSAAKNALLERLRAVTLGRYDVRGELGRGGMAAVFLAYDLRLNRRVALKVMLPGLAFTEGMAERFEQEARTAANLDHPNIVTIFSVEEAEDLLLFAMKYIEGKSLERVLKDCGALPVDVTAFILIQVAGALQYAHDERVIHRDVKPGNVLLDRRGTPIVSDFGIAKAAESSNLTMTGAIVGTPAYMSPEQFRGKSAVPASDQYALGIVAYEMLVGETPFTGSMLELQLAHLTQQARPLREVRPEVPPVLNDVIMRMLDKTPEARWPTLTAAADAMRASLRLDETTTRNRLVEVGLLVSGAPTFGLPATPISPLITSKTRAVPKSGEGPAWRTPVPGPTPSGSPTPPGTTVPAGGPPTPAKREEAALFEPTVIEPRVAPPPRVVAPAPAPQPAMRDIAIRAPVERAAVPPPAAPAPVVKPAPPPGPPWWAPALEATKRAGAFAQGAARRVPTLLRAAQAQVGAAARSGSRASTAGFARLAGAVSSIRLSRNVLYAGAGVVVLAVAVPVVMYLKRQTTQAVPNAGGSGTTTVVSSSTQASGSTTTPPANPAAPVDNTPSGTSTSSTSEITGPGLEIRGAPQSLRLSESARLRTLVRDSLLRGAAVVWRSSRPDVVVVDARTGMITARNIGDADISAEAGTARASVHLSVILPAVTGVEMANWRSQLNVGESVNLNARVRTDAGQLDDATIARLGLTPRWSSATPDVAQVDPVTGVVTGLKSGVATIVLTAGSYTDEKMLTVVGGYAAPPPRRDPPPETPRTTPRAKSSDELQREALQVIRDFASAIEARSLDGLLRAFPTLNADERRSFQVLFNDARDDPKYRIESAQLQGTISDADGSEARFRVTHALSFYSKAARREVPNTGTETWTLVRTAQGWKIRRIE